jgi:hypothetical protein
MLSDIRKRVRVVMFIVAVAFVAGFLMGEIWRMLATRGTRRGRDTHGYVGQVGKHNITPEEYRNALSYITDKYKGDNQLRDLSNEDYQKIEQQTWKFLVSELTWAKVLKTANIFVTEEEVMELIRNNPPPELHEKPELMTDGKFDHEKYMQVMSAPENREYFYNYFREIIDALPKEKFRIDILSAYRVTGAETEDGLSAANSRWKTTSLYFGPQALKEKVEPSEAEARSWYDAHKEDFRTRQIRQLRYVLFPLAVSREDSTMAKELIDRAYDQLLTGESFNLTVIDYSDMEGDTLPAMTPRAGLDKLTDSILSGLRPGRYSQPFLAGYGWQIVLLDSLKEDSVSFRRIIVRVKMGSEVLAAARDSVRSFLQATVSEKFDTVAARFGLKVQAARPLVGDQRELPGLPIDNTTTLIEWARAAKPGQVFDLPQRGPDGYYVFELAEVRPAGIQEFEKVKQAATWRARQEREKQAWLAMANQAVDAVKVGKTLEQYAQENPAVELQAEEFEGLTDCRRKKGPEFAGALAALSPGEKCGPVVANWGAFIIRCDERTSSGTLDAAGYTEQRTQQVAQYLMREMLTEPEVRDYRNALAY